MLKGLEKLFDWCIRGHELVEHTLHKYQYAYQPGKSSEGALHHVVGRVERSLNEKCCTMGVLPDIEEAFNMPSVDTIVNSDRIHGVDQCNLYR